MYSGDSWFLIDDDGIEVPPNAEGSYLMQHALQSDSVASDGDDDWTSGQNSTCMGDREQSQKLFDALESFLESHDAVPVESTAAVSAHSGEISSKYSATCLSMTSPEEDQAREEENEEGDNFGMFEAFSREYTDEAETDWILEDVLKRRTRQGDRQYLCKWKYYADPTWESRGLMCEEGYQDVLDKYDFDVLKHEQPKKDVSVVPSAPLLWDDICKACDLYSYIQRAFLERTMTALALSNVTKPSLIRRFLASKRKYPDLIPQIVFHGTRAKNIPSVIAHGLLVPHKSHISVTHGEVHGRGIYTALDPAVPCSYCTNCMFVCIGLVSPDRRDGSARFAANGRYVIFSKEDLILPVCLVQFERKRPRNRDVKSIRIVSDWHQLDVQYEPYSVSLSNRGPTAEHERESKRLGPMSKKMIKQAPRKVKELYTLGVLQGKK